MAYKNQLTFLLKNVQLVEVIKDEDIEIGNDVKRKITAVVSATGKEQNSDELEIFCWGKVADKMDDFSDGTFLDLECTAKTRWVDRSDGDGQFSATDVTAFYVGEHKEERPRAESRGRSTERTAASTETRRGSRVDDGKKSQAEPDAKEETRKTGNRPTRNRR